MLRMGVEARRGHRQLLLQQLAGQLQGRQAITDCVIQCRWVNLILILTYTLGCLLVTLPASSFNSPSVLLNIYSSPSFHLLPTLSLPTYLPPTPHLLPTCSPVMVTTTPPLSSSPPSLQPWHLC